MGMMPAESAESKSIPDYWAILKEYRWLIFFSFLCLVVVSVILTKLSPKVYRAHTTLFVYADWAGDVNVSPAAVAAGIVTPTAQDYVLLLLKSDALAESAISRLKLDRNPRFLRGKGPFSREALLGAYQGMVKVSANFNRKIVVEVYTKDPQLSADIANASIDVLTSSIVERAKSKVGFLAEELQKVKAELGTDEEALKHFQETTHWVDLDDQMKGMVGAQTDAEKELLMDRIKLARNERLSETSGAVQELVQLEAENTALKTEIALYEKNLKKMDIQMQRLPTSSMTYARLTREVKVKEDILRALVQEYEASSMKQEGEIIPYRVIDRAYPPMSAFKPVLRTNLMIAGVIGLLIGIAVALYLDSKSAPPPSQPAPETPEAEPPAPAADLVW